MTTILTEHGPEQVERSAAMEDSKGDRIAGSLKGKINIAADFFEPLPPEELDHWD